MPHGFDPTILREYDIRGIGKSFLQDRDRRFSERRSSKFRRAYPARRLKSARPLPRPETTTSCTASAIAKTDSAALGWPFQCASAAAMWSCQIAAIVRWRWCCQIVTRQL